VKVLVDTSVWADFFNEHASPEAAALAKYLESEAEIATCGVVLAEFFQGLRSASIATLEPYFRDMELLVPSEPDSYFAAASLFRQLRHRGITVRSMVDCLIVQLAAEHDALLLAKDRDMALILDSGLSRASAAPLVR
jgi:predicted nucleic acid-binding protein